ncbi:MAG: esterase/lipase family protein, partial [Pirellulaceae bacterium]
MLLAVCAAGCSSPSYLARRSEPFNPLSATLQLVSWSGPKPSERSQKLLRRYDLDEANGDERLRQLETEVAKEPNPEKLYAFAELAYIEACRADKRKDRGRAVDLYGAAVAHAYWYLFDVDHDLMRNPYDPQFRGACDLYNEALEGALRIAKQEGELRPGRRYRLANGRQKFDIDVVLRGPWHDDDFDKVEFVSDFEIKGLANRHHTYGLGVPLIAVRRNHAEMDAAESYYPPGLSFAVTAFLRVSASLDECRESDEVRRCVLELHDPLYARDIEVAGRRVPLETDLTTPLAYFLDNPEFREAKDISTLGLRLPELAKSRQGMFMVEPYDPRKIPVLMVHGLWSSPITWMEMFNDLRSFPEVREHYQFWFYLYPTGQPFWISARQLRDDLQTMRRTLDPGHLTPALDQMVLVGHSMGGLVSKLQTVESGDNYWKLLSDRPFADLNADSETRHRLARTVFFQPNPSIRRVITIGTPHRGSEFANNYTRWLGRKLIHLPEMMVQATQGLTRNNPDFFRDTDLLTISTSIDSLSPDSPVLPLCSPLRRLPGLSITTSWDCSRMRGWLARWR